MIHDGGGVFYGSEKEEDQAWEEAVKHQQEIKSKASENREIHETVKSMHGDSLSPDDFIKYVDVIPYSYEVSANVRQNIAASIYIKYTQGLKVKQLCPCGGYMIILYEDI